MWVKGFDIMKYKHKSLANADFTLNEILDISSEGFWDWNALTGDVNRSPGWYRMLDYDVDEFANTVFTWEAVIHPEDFVRVMKHFEAYINGEIAEYKIQYRCKKSDASYIWIEDSGKIVEKTQNGKVARMIGAHTNIHEAKITNEMLHIQNDLLCTDNLTLENIITKRTNELHDINQKLLQQLEVSQHSASYDTLTGVYNRYMFEEHLKKEMHRAKRYSNALSVILMDIDDFKAINDNHGHKIGDEILIELAILLQKHLRESDIIARWGGEEFIIIFPEMALSQTKHKAEELRKLIENEIFTKSLKVTCSFGVTEYIPGDTLDSIFIRSDDAMYQAKASHKNCVKCFEKA